MRILFTAPAIFSTIVLAGCAWFSPAAVAAAGDSVDPYEVLYFQAQMAIVAKDYEWGIENLEPVVRDPGCPPELIAALAECYLRANRWDESLEVASDLIERYPSFVPGYQTRSQIYRRRGKRGAAIADLESALELVPRHTEFLQALGELRSRSVKTWTLGEGPDDPIRELLNVYERLVEIARGREKVPYLIVLSSVATRTGDYEAAVRYGEQAVRLHRRGLRPLLTLAAAREAVGAPLEALAEYRRALVLDPQNRLVRIKVLEILEKEKVEGGRVKFFGDLANSFSGVSELQLLYAEELIRGEQWSEAVGHLEKVSEIHTDDPGVKGALIRAYFGADQDGRGRELLDSYVDDPRTTTDQLLRLSDNLRARGKYDLALDLLERVAERDGREKRILFTIAQVQIDAGRDERAIAALEEALEADPDLFRAVSVLADLYSGEKRFDDAHGVFGAMSDQAKAQWSFEIDLKHAQLYSIEEKHDEAIDILARLLREGKPPEVIVLRILVDAYVETDREEEAYRAVDDFIDRAPVGAQRGGRSIKAWLYWRADEHEKAIEVLEGLQAEDPADIATLRMLVENYAEIDAFEKAEGLMQAAEAQLGGEVSDEFLLLRARLFHLQGKHVEAVGVMEELLARSEERKDYLMIAGEYYYEADAIEDAERVLRRAIELDPDDAESYNALGYFLAEAGVKLDEAEALVQKALELRPDAGHIIDSLGWVYYMRGRFPEAIVTLESAVAKMESSPDPVVFEHLGDAYSKDDQPERAQELWRKALELDPKSETLKKKLE